jgi:hypothetical protein
MDSSIEVGDVYQLKENGVAKVPQFTIVEIYTTFPKINCRILWDFGESSELANINIGEFKTHFEKVLPVTGDYKIGGLYKPLHKRIDYQSTVMLLEIRNLSHLLELSVLLNGKTGVFYYLTTEDFLADYELIT